MVLKKWHRAYCPRVFRDGEWNLTIQEVENSEATNTLFKSTFNFEKGIPQQNFNIENDSSALVGRFLRNGMAHDEWISYGSNALEVDEVWYFEEGLLQKIVFDTTGKEVAVFENGMAQFRTVPLDDRFLLVLEYNLQERFDESSITALLSKNWEQYQKINGLLTRLGSTSFATNMKVKVPVYPLDSLQLESLKNIALHFDRATEIASTILTNSHLNIVRRTDDQAQYWYSIAREIETKFIKPLSIYVDLYENQIFEFVNPITIQERIFPMGMPNKSIRLDGDESGDSSSFQLPRR
ncbi:hypothetical protein NYZ99_10150 [Maribacter litopenaei]|uniref:Uncharacterized protein n=1 Tax=Maribacter litopenaei TaxID=2976127 RepID=A0ABY5YC57_9FLAO|nr:hypothetical protein [Maribacter litopenaei]UWX56509.1 hypothetical protein NYZ99_10150 [Maribacter litopenaei]